MTGIRQTNYAKWHAPQFTQQLHWGSANTGSESTLLVVRELMFVAPRVILREARTRHMRLNGARYNERHMQFQGREKHSRTRKLVR